MTRAAWYAMLGLFALSCAKQSGSGAEAGTGGASTANESACTASALRLGDAKPATIWKPPNGCTLQASGGAPLVVRSEAELEAHMKCATKTSSGIAFDRDALVIAPRTMSPASVGTNVLDDGKTVTFVNKQRSPCKGDPMPMPMSFALAFTIPASSPARAFAEASCTVETKCP